MLIAGIDIGSGTTKCVLVDEAGAVRGRGIVKTKANFEKVAAEVLEMARGDAGAAESDVGYVATTGLGRYAVPFRDIQITDLTCGARGAARSSVDSASSTSARCSRATVRERQGEEFPNENAPGRVRARGEAPRGRWRTPAESVKYQAAADFGVRGLAGPVINHISRRRAVETICGASHRWRPVAPLGRRWAAVTLIGSAVLQEG
jgi:hypothetical protein